MNLLTTFPIKIIIIILSLFNYYQYQTITKFFSQIFKHSCKMSLKAFLEILTTPTSFFEMFLVTINDFYRKFWIIFTNKYQQLANLQKWLPSFSAIFLIHFKFSIFLLKQAKTKLNIRSFISQNFARLCLDPIEFSGDFSD